MRRRAAASWDLPANWDVISEEEIRDIEVAHYLINNNIIYPSLCIHPMLLFFISSIFVILLYLFSIFLIFIFFTF